MIHDLNNLIDSYQNKKGKKLVFLMFLMFDHIGGLNTLLNCLSMGVTMVFPESRDPELVARLIEKYKVNILPASPTFLNLILISEAQTRYDMSSLRMITYGTEPMPESLLAKLKDTFGRVKFLQTFGTSETGITQTLSKSSNSTFIKIDDPNTEYKIIDGELWIRSKTQIMGYLNSSMERFTDDGWFKTGDLVEEAEDGYIKIVGRNKELINVGGEKVLPSEVESVLFQIPDLMDCIVYGEPNPITGQMVTAKVLFKDAIKTSEAKKRVVSFCQDKLDRYKIPAKVVLMSESEYSDRFKKKRI
jgi:acyl-coenzyme A synthetase/AMP-(fatty) acid ligase